jgi:hypothetical protein
VVGSPDGSIIVGFLLNPHPARASPKPPFPNHHDLQKMVIYTRFLIRSPHLPTHGIHYASRPTQRLLPGARNCLRSPGGNRGLLTKCLSLTAPLRSTGSGECLHGKEGRFIEQEKNLSPIGSGTKERGIDDNEKDIPRVGFQGERPKSEPETPSAPEAGPKTG